MTEQELNYRKVWVATVPAKPELAEAGFQVLIEQFGESPPTVAFRPTPQHVWGRPHQSEEAPS
jgi:hypothetical protein